MEQKTNYPAYLGTLFNPKTGTYHPFMYKVLTPKEAQDKKEQLQKFTPNRDWDEKEETTKLVGSVFLDGLSSKELSLERNQQDGENLKLRGYSVIQVDKISEWDGSSFNYDEYIKE